MLVRSDVLGMCFGGYAKLDQRSACTAACMMVLLPPFSDRTGIYEVHMDQDHGYVQWRRRDMVIMPISFLASVL